KLLIRQQLQRRSHDLQAFASALGQRANTPLISSLLVSEATRLIDAIGQGDPRAADELLPLVYDELRRLARAQMARERVGQTLQTTALVHEAYLRLVGDEAIRWNSRGHFFAAAGEAMRRILVENARRKHRLKHGGGRARVNLEDIAVAADERPDELLALDEALTALEAADALAARVVKLRYFAGLTMPEVAKAMDLPLRTVERNW